MVDLVFGIETGYQRAGKVYSIIGDGNVGKPKAAHYVLPKQLDNLLHGDFRERHYLNLFS